jgi:RimJ/RimL family protein N-acetyltransferase
VVGVTLARLESLSLVTCDLKDINMANWITYPTTLTGEIVDLIPLERKHFSDLQALAKDKRIWEFYPYDGSDPVKMQDILDTALAEREKGTQFPFAVFNKADDKVIGSTRLMDIQFRHRKLEIGTT